MLSALTIIIISKKCIKKIVISPEKMYKTIIVLKHKIKTYIGANFSHQLLLIEQVIAPLRAFVKRMVQPHACQYLPQRRDLLLSYCRDIFTIPELQDLEREETAISTIRRKQKNVLKAN